MHVLFALLTINLFVGCGETVTHRMSPDIIQYFKSRGIYVEATTSNSAASTFNILNAEERNVAAALLTMKPRPPDERDVIQEYFPEMKRR